MIIFYFTLQVASLPLSNQTYSLIQKSIPSSASWSFPFCSLRHLAHVRSKVYLAFISAVIFLVFVSNPEFLRNFQGNLSSSSLD